GLPSWRANPGIDHRREIVADVKVCIYRKINKKIKKDLPYVVSGTSIGSLDSTNGLNILYFN
ncbi:MAG: hypothetical protein MUO88_05705, partial [Desulfobacterales bacterium]|nr:hypothetical protein [Desulfobacterales bacterium]